MSRILIVDDKPENLYLLRVLLQGCGHTVDEANNGADALEKATHAAPDLIISDLLMPVMDGYTLLRRWRADASLRAIPFIVHTASYTDSKDELLAMKLGADSFILKPAEPGPFIDRISALLARKERGEPSPAGEPDGEVTGLYKEYSEVLVRRLEDKSLQLEQANRALREDLAERERVETEMRRSADLLRAVVEGTHDAVFVKDRAGRYLMLNDAGIRFAGKPAAEILGRDDVPLFGADAARILMASDRQVMDSNRNETVVESVVSGGVSRTFQSVKAPYRDGQGNVIGVIGVARDVTDRIRAEETLLLRDRAIQAVSQGILITDPNQPDNPIIFASAGFERMTGYRAQDILGRNCRFLQGKGTDAETVGELRAAIASGRACSVEIQNYRKDGTPFWNQLTISPVLGPAGQVTHFVGVQSDVTERRRLEEQFRQAQKMEAVGVLAGGVAHDFNNLLTIINGYSDLLLGRLAPGDPTHEALAEILKAGQKAGALTRQLLAFSRQQVLEPRVLNLNSVVSDAEKMLRRLIGEDISLVTTLRPNLGRVKADQGQIEQILMNLVVNARDAMPNGGSLTIETQEVSLDQSYCQAFPGLVPGDYVQLAVGDTGCGMNAAIQERVFEPFFTTKGVGRGTGLGLATVHGIVKQSRGHVAFYSEVGLGTTFKVYFPRISDPLARMTADAPSPSMPEGGETVLLAEDEEGVRALASLVLRDCGYEVLEANNGNEAIRVSESHPGAIQLLISDVVMPHLGGRALAERLTAMRPDCKVLFLSGYTDDAVVRHGVLEAEVAFLQKPFSPSSLAQKVRSVLDGSKSADA